MRLSSVCDCSKIHPASPNIAKRILGNSKKEMSRMGFEPMTLRILRAGISRATAAPSALVENCFQDAVHKQPATGILKRAVRLRPWFLPGTCKARIGRTSHRWPVDTSLQEFGNSSNWVLEDPDFNFSLHCGCETCNSAKQIASPNENQYYNLKLGPA
ncbi:hypothetical protein LIA77_05238 [Sarocladium implicatum]|nr:hypothetical protein LIA77_05238 [Sarocladium implicatum]